MANRKRVAEDDILPVTIRSVLSVAVAVILLLLFNIREPAFAKSFDIPLAVLLAVAVFIRPELSIVLGFAAGMVCDAYSDRLYLFHTMFYSLPGTFAMLMGDAAILRSPQPAIIVVVGFIILKFLAQYFWLFILGLGDWPTVLGHLDWWGAVLLAILLAFFWKPLGTLVSGVNDEPKFKRDTRGAR